MPAGYTRSGPRGFAWPERRWRHAASFAGHPIATRELVEHCPACSCGALSLADARLYEAARALGMRVENAAGVEAALQALSRLAYEIPPRILITGSLYLAGHVLAVNGTPPA